MKARRAINKAAKTCHTMKAIELQKVLDLAPGHAILVYREDNGCSKYTFLPVKGNDVDVAIPSDKISTFGINVVRPFCDSMEGSGNSEKKENNFPETSEGSPSNNGQYNTTTWSRTNYLCKDNVVHGYTFTSIENDFHNSSRLEEIETLFRLGSFKVNSVSEYEGHRLCRLRFDDKIKADGSKRSRLAWQLVMIKIVDYSQPHQQ